MFVRRPFGEAAVLLEIAVYEFVVLVLPGPQKYVKEWPF